MNLTPILIGASAFAIIGIFHPIVVKAEYYFSKRVWPAFLAIGLLCILAALFCRYELLADFLAIFGFASLWSIREIFEQEERVRKGWFPANPKRK